MLDAGLIVTINSDDPAFFGGYVGENYQAVQEGLGLDDRTLAELAGNSFRAKFLDDERDERPHHAVERVYVQSSEGDIRRRRSESSDAERTLFACT